MEHYKLVTNDLRRARRENLLLLIDVLGSARQAAKLAGVEITTIQKIAKEKTKMVKGVGGSWKEMVPNFTNELARLFELTLGMPPHEMDKPHDIGWARRVCSVARQAQKLGLPVMDSTAMLVMDIRKVSMSIAMLRAAATRLNEQATALEDLVDQMGSGIKESDQSQIEAHGSAQMLPASTNTPDQ